MSTMLSLWRGDCLLTGHVGNMRDIAKRVAQARGCSLNELLGESRERVIAWPRQEAMWACRQIRRADGQPRYSYPQIGAFFGRDHTTVIAAVRRVNQRQAAQSNGGDA